MKRLLLLLFITTNLFASGWGKTPGEFNVTAIEMSGMAYSFVVGTTNGLYFTTTMPSEAKKIDNFTSGHVTSLCYVEGSLWVTVIDGEESGLYQGVNVLDGFPYFSFTKKHSIANPQLVRYHKDELLVVGLDSLYVYDLKPNVAFQKTYELPANSFGTIDPHCAAGISEGDVFLFGGYDRDESGDDAMVLRYNGRAVEGGSLKNDIYALGSSPGNKWGYWGENNRLYMVSMEGTMMDDSIITTPYETPVHAMTHINNAEFVSASNVVVATDSGVFAHENGAWKELGSIDATPSTLYVDYFGFAATPILLAGTDKGLYVYSGESSVISARPQEERSLTVEQGVVTLPKDVSNASVSVLNLHGQQLFHKEAATHSVKLPTLAAGIYTVKMSHKGQVTAFPYLVK